MVISVISGVISVDFGDFGQSCYRYETDFYVVKSSMLYLCPLL